MALGLWSTGLIVVAHKLSFMACGIFEDQGVSPELAGGFFTIEPQGKPWYTISL